MEMPSLAAMPVSWYQFISVVLAGRCFFLRRWARLGGPGFTGYCHANMGQRYGPWKTPLTVRGHDHCVSITEFKAHTQQILLNLGPIKHMEIPSLAAIHVWWYRFISVNRIFPGRCFLRRWAGLGGPGFTGYCHANMGQRHEPQMKPPTVIGHGHHVSTTKSLSPQKANAT